MRYEFGYALAIDGESLTTILERWDKCEFEKKKDWARLANTAERRPGVRGKILPNPAIYFIREVKRFHMPDIMPQSMAERELGLSRGLINSWLSRETLEPFLVSGERWLSLREAAAVLLNSKKEQI